MGIEESLGSYNAAHAEAPATYRAEGPGTAVIGLSGELDMKSSSDLAPLLEAVLQGSPEGGRLVLDLSEVNYIASMGVGLLANVMVKAQARRVSLTLRDIPPEVRTIMDALGLLSYFPEERSPGESRR